MALNIKVRIPEEEAEISDHTIENNTESACQNSENCISDDQFSVPESKISVPKPHLLKLVKKALKVLEFTKNSLSSSEFRAVHVRARDIYYIPYQTTAKDIKCP